MKPLNVVAQAGNRTRTSHEDADQQRPYYGRDLIVRYKDLAKPTMLLPNYAKLFHL